MNDERSHLGELGSGVESLGLMTIAFALAQLVAAPFMETLADRIGRRPIVLVSLFAFVVAMMLVLLFLRSPQRAAGEAKDMHARATGLWPRRPLCAASWCAPGPYGTS